jgi:formylmethanofuran dehydrogenase subunit E
MHEELTRGEWSLLRVALRLHIYEYNHEDEHLRELNSVYNKLVGMELAYDQAQSGNVKCQSCGEWYSPDAPDDWGTHLIELCGPCYTRRLR